MGLPTLFCLPLATWRRCEAHIYAALCTTPSDSFQGTPGPRAPLGCTSLRCLLSVSVSSSDSAITQSLHGMKSEDSESPVVIHPPTHSFRIC